MRRVECPGCGKDFVRQMPPRGRWDRLLCAAGVFPFRCQLCGRRFRARGEQEPPPAADRIERREYQRLPVRLPAAFGWDRGEGEGIVTDLSIAGCSLEAEAPVAEGDLLRLSLRPEEGAPAIVVEAAVVRYAGPWRVGLQFLRIQGAERDRLRALLQQVFQDAEARRAAGLGILAGEARKGLGPGPDSAPTPEG